MCSLFTIMHGWVPVMIKGVIQSHPPVTGQDGELQHANPGHHRRHQHHQHYQPKQVSAEYKEKAKLRHEVAHNLFESTINMNKKSLNFRIVHRKLRRETCNYNKLKVNYTYEK